MIKSFATVVEEFRKEATWLGGADEVGVVMLQQIAEELDSNGLSGPLLQQFGIVYRDLCKRAPREAAPVDPLEEALSEAE